MRELVFPRTREEDDVVKQWFAEMHGHNGYKFSGDSYSYCVVDEGEIVAAAVIQPFHAAGDFLLSGISNNPRVFFSRGLTKRFFRVPFGPPFNARRVTLFLNEVDEMEIKLAQRLGFKIEGRVRGHFGDSDGVLLGMLRSEMVGG